MKRSICLGTILMLVSLTARADTIEMKVFGMVCGFCAQGIEATVLSSSVASGDVARGIVDLARKAGADVIIAGNSRRGVLARLLVSDVASRLLQTAPCAVLIVPSLQKADTPSESTVSSAA